MKSSARAGDGGVHSLRGFCIPTSIRARPDLGKLADIQHENQLAARYVTWERTVWFDNLSGENRDDFSRSGNDWENVALRSASSVTASMQNRFFQTYSNGPVNLITSGDLGTRSPSDQWRYVQSGEAILRDVSVNNFRELKRLV